MTKVDFAVTFQQLSGEPIQGEGDKPFTLRDAAAVALDASFEDEKKLDPKEKYRRGALAARIYGAKEPIALDVDDLKLVKDQIGRAYGPHIVKMAWDLLDAPEELAKDPEPKIPSTHRRKA